VPTEELDDRLGRALVDITHQMWPYSNAARGNVPVELVVA
jgi:organic hydroperoxide reductase OsmC/OhrA